jgi:hypothetical protein
MENKKGELLVGIGIVLFFVGPMLKFYEITGDRGSLSFSGYDAEEASPYIVAAVLALVGLAMAYMLKGGGRMAGGVIILLAGIFATYGGIVDSFQDPGEVTADISFSRGLGPYVVLAAGILVVIGAILIMKSSEPAPVAPAEPPPPSA